MVGTDKRYLEYLRNNSAAVCGKTALPTTMSAYPRPQQIYVDAHDISCSTWGPEQKAPIRIDNSQRQSMGDQGDSKVSCLVTPLRWDFTVERILRK